jgi:hypothetical protein
MLRNNLKHHFCHSEFSSKSQFRIILDPEIIDKSGCTERTSSG